MEIRAFEEADWPQVHAIVRRVVDDGETYAYDPAWSEAELRDVWVERPPGLTVVAVDDGVVLGTAKTGPNRPAAGAHVSTASFMVSPAARGKQVGRRLGEHVLTWAREQGYRSMQFNAVVETNTAAVHLWQSLGFEIIGTVPEAFRRPDGSLAGLHVMYQKFWIYGRGVAVRAGIVVTGTEVLTGRVTDRNGPWLAEELRRHGVDVGQVVVVGDRPDDLAAALRYLAATTQLVITSGGLGPTADDLTAQVVADVQGRAVRLDPDLEKRIAAIVERLMARLPVPLDPDATAAGVHKQAMVPEGATVLEPTGTAPGLVVTAADGDTPPVVVLPGPPRELQGMWPAALETAAVRAVLAGAGEIRQRTLRLWGLPEAELAALLRRIDGELAGLEITTCLRDGELEIVSRYAPEAEPAHERLLAAVENEYGAKLFSTDGREVDELVAEALAARGWSVAVVESLTGGAMSARLTRALEGGPAVRAAVVGTGARHETTVAGSTSMAQAARDELEAQVGIGVTGVDPSGAPATTVHVAVVTPETERRRTLSYDAPPAVLRARVPTVAMHLLREALI